ncbi:hypothetical protein [Rossellomorea sp. FM04394]|uniref:hypothetical protein n=1 Tax=Rossellomorea sp. FM04394 TaxID=3243076 RepID=UPI0035A71088
MNYKVILCLGLPILTMAYGINQNFHVFLTGSPATFTNFIVTIVYFVIWIMCFGIAFKAKNKLLMRIYTMAWVLTLVIALLTAYINFSDTPLYFGWAIPLAALFLTPWVGLNYLVDSFSFTSTVVAIISLIMIAIIFKKANWKEVISLIKALP